MSRELDLSPIKARLAKITPGPWKLNVSTTEDGCPHLVVEQVSLTPNSVMGPYHETIAFYVMDGQDMPPDEDTLNDFQFIAHSAADVAALVTEVERLRARLQGFRVVERSSESSA